LVWGSISNQKPTIANAYGVIEFTIPIINSIGCAISVITIIFTTQNIQMRKSLLN
jgi:hypothetical protein